MPKRARRRRTEDTPGHAPDVVPPATARANAGREHGALLDEWTRARHVEDRRVRAALDYRAAPDQRRSRFDHPYLESFLHLVPGAATRDAWQRLRNPGGFVMEFSAREHFVRRYAWAIPSDEAIETIARYGPVVEIGAGTGYWAWLVTQAGAAVTCYDAHPRPALTVAVGAAPAPGAAQARRVRARRVASPPDTASRSALGVIDGLARHSYHPVLPGGPEAAGRHPGHALLLCWPPYAERMAYDALRQYTGQHLIYVGESEGGCTGDDRFFAYRHRHFEEIERVAIPQWVGVHDDLSVWRRK